MILRTKEPVLRTWLPGEAYRPREPLPGYLLIMVRQRSRISSRIDSAAA